jgi:hypothetical protein
MFDIVAHCVHEEQRWYEMNESDKHTSLRLGIQYNNTTSNDMQCLPVQQISALVVRVLVSVAGARS